MADPPEQPARSKPEPRSDYKPENAPQDLPVINLPYTWDEETQNRRRARISHSHVIYDKPHEKDSSPRGGRHELLFLFESVLE